MGMLDKSCKEFLAELASAAPVPGGGGAAGLGGAIGMALANMVANLTIGKEKYAEDEEEIEDLLAEGEKLGNALLASVEKDAEVFLSLAEAYKLPASTDAEKAHKKSVLSEQAKPACEVPLAAARVAEQGLQINRRLAEIGNKMVISDIGCGAYFLWAALQSAVLNMRINLANIAEPNYVMSIEQEIEWLLSRGEEALKDTLETMEERMAK